MGNNNSVIAYDKGINDFLKGKPFKSNPYKNPDLSVTWGLGWTRAKKAIKEKGYYGDSIRKRKRELK